MNYISNIFMGSECGHNIYEEPSEDMWAECTMKLYNLGLKVGIPVIIIVVLVFMYFDFYRWIAPVVGICLIAIALFSGRFIEKSARINHRRVQIQIQRYIDNGMTRAEAISEIKDTAVKWKLNNSRNNTLLTAASMIGKK